MSLCMIDILTAVSMAAEVKREMITGPRRFKDLCTCRQAVILLIKEKCPARTLADIGRFLGGRDHTSVIHHATVGQKKLDEDPDFRRLFYDAKVLLLSAEGGDVQAWRGSQCEDYQVRYG